jgi:magnesium transporter
MPDRDPPPPRHPPRSASPDGDGDGRSEPRNAATEAARATLNAAGAIPRVVAWTALAGTRRLERELRHAGVPLPRLHTFRRRAPAGTAPGTLTSHPDAGPPVIRVLGYGPDGLEELAVAEPAGLAELRDRWPVLWVNVDGVGDAGAIEAIGDVFGLHRLALEDVMNVHQRPKVEEYDDYVFAVTRMASLAERLDTEQLGLFLGDGWVLTFQERPGDCWDLVRERLRAGRGRIRSQGADFLFYALIDAVVDHVYPLLEEFGTRMEVLEEEVIERPRREMVAVIHAARRDLMALRHTAWPMREAVGQLYRDPIRHITDSTRFYLRDTYDHTVQVIDLLENFREMASALMEVYLSSVNQRMNEVMKVLTIIATIFIPLTFIVGIYGMNFDPDASPWNMPELGWYWGYPAVMLLMLSIAVGLLGFFRWRQWF